MKIGLTAVTYDEAEIAEVIDSLRSGSITMGAKCRLFERAFAARLGARHAVFVNSGSSANLLAWFALVNPLCKVQGGPLSPGFEVIVPAVAWATTIWPVVQAGGLPVLVDCDPLTFAIRPEAVEAAIGPKTAAVFVVHPLGNVCDMTSLTEVCTRRNILLLEDSCEALGSRFGGREAGTFGLMGTYSFYFSHHITTVEGGMVVTNDDGIAELLRVLRSHGWSRQDQSGAKVPFLDRYRFITTGFNLRPTELNAAFGLHQLKKLDAFNRARRSTTEALLVAIAPIVAAGHLRPMRVQQEVDAAFFGFPVVCRTREIRDALVEHLESGGVETRPIICGNMARQPAFRHTPHRVFGSLEGADEIMDRGLYWGMHPAFHEPEVEHLAQLLSEFEWH